MSCQLTVAAGLNCMEFGVWHWLRSVELQISIGWGKGIMPNVGKVNNGREGVKMTHYCRHPLYMAPMLLCMPSVHGCNHAEKLGMQVQGSGDGCSSPDNGGACVWSSTW